MTHAMDYARKVTKISAGNSGYINVQLACRHVIELEPSRSETSGQKARRFQDALGNAWPCPDCHRLSHRASITASAASMTASRPGASGGESG